MCCKHVDIHLQAMLYILLADQPLSRYPLVVCAVPACTEFRPCQRKIGQLQKKMKVMTVKVYPAATNTIHLCLSCSTTSFQVGYSHYAVYNCSSHSCYVKAEKPKNALNLEKTQVLWGIFRSGWNMFVNVSRLLCSVSRKLKQNCITGASVFNF